MARGWVVLAVVAVLFAPGCAGSGTGTAESTARSGLDLTAEVDPARGSVTLPGDRFLATPAESGILFSAESAAKAACARDHGLVWTAWPLVDAPEYDMDADFGPWTVQMAQKFAFVKPAPHDELAINGDLPGAVVDPSPGPHIPVSEEEAEAVHDTCRDDPLFKKFQKPQMVRPGPWEGELYGTYEAVPKDPRAREVFGELRACYATRGLTFDEEVPGLVKEAKYVITEQQISLALKVVECQEKTDATRRLANIQADLQAPIIEKYADELVAHRAQIDTALVEAKAYIAQHPELFEAPK